MKHTILHKLVYLTLFGCIYTILLAQVGCGGASLKPIQTAGAGSSQTAIQVGTKGIIEQVTDLIIVVALIVLAFYCVKQLSKGTWSWFGG